jgi:hypothetical protein
MALVKRKSSALQNHKTKLYWVPKTSEFENLSQWLSNLKSYNKLNYLTLIPNSISMISVLAKKLVAEPTEMFSLGSFKESS